MLPFVVSTFGLSPLDDAMQFRKDHSCYLPVLEHLMSPLCSRVTGATRETAGASVRPKHQYRLLYCGNDIYGSLSFTFCLAHPILSLGTSMFNKYICIIPSKRLVILPSTLSFSVRCELCRDRHFASCKHVSISRKDKQWTGSGSTPPAASMCA